MSELTGAVQVVRAASEPMRAPAILDVHARTGFVYRYIWPVLLAGLVLIIGHLDEGPDARRIALAEIERARGTVLVPPPIGEMLTPPPATRLDLPDAPQLLGQRSVPAKPVARSPSGESQRDVFAFAAPPLRLPHMPPDMPTPPVVPPAAPLVPPDAHRGPDMAALGHEATCRWGDPPVTRVSAARPSSLSDEFGERLVAVALEQSHDLVVYNPKYLPIAYPNGDVPRLYGVCTDVLIRAYRRLGIDLQRLIYLTTGDGLADRSITHRRTVTLQRFLTQHGQVLPITAFSEDYLPGDIVTYYRPQNRSSTAHIALVTADIAPSGRPLILHNRGWSVQLEDALFVDRITGHYRFTDLDHARLELRLAAPVVAEARPVAMPTAVDSRTLRARPPLTPIPRQAAARPPLTK